MYPPSPPSAPLPLSSLQDHAKWAIAADTSNVLCIGDINRMTTQRRRGGGAVCFEHAGMANALYNSIDTSFTCKSEAEAAEAAQVEAQVVMA